VSVKPTLPLSHITVLDLTRILAGPWCTQLLADLGATVIKIEHPQQGDDTRTWGPPFVRDANGNDTTDSAYGTCCNRGKESVCIDFTQAEGQALVQALAKRADVVVENFKVGGLKKYGLDYESLRALNPQLIYCSITGFGQTGPYADRAGYDYIAQGMGGLMSVTGEADDQPGGGPQKVGVAVTDLFTGLYAANAVQAALIHRTHTGVGQHIDLALLDTSVAIMANMNQGYLVSGVVPKRMGNAHPNIVPYQVLACADGHLILGVGNDRQFKAFCEAAGEPQWAADERFTNNAGRVRNRAALVPELARIVVARTQRDWIETLEAVHVPCGPINSIDQVFADPQVQHRQMKVNVPHANAGSLPTVRQPIKFSDSPLRYEKAVPVLGEHTTAILRDKLSLPAAQIAALRAKNVIS
jgi:crotonobetainyl-CoA:carnitine CoA-transferase CaiB-like acyl-CoA transferase